MDHGVMEGFLCPICIVDLKSPGELSAHFEDAHAEDKVVYQQFKSVFSKAKRKLLKESETTSSTTKSDVSSKVFVSNGRPYTGGIDLALWEKQTLGSTCGHTKEFREQRKEAIESIVVETNKLIIRLEKLIKSGIYASDSSLPGAIKTRRNIEKSVVPWDSDDNAKSCRNCATKFSIMYRRHHCRLCGQVICEKCLDNLDMAIACGVLKLDTQKASSYVKFPTENSEPENGLKVCYPCDQLLVRQNQLIQDKLANTSLIQLYDRMQSSMKEASITQPKYLRIAESLNAGETEFNLEVAIDMRLKLLKSYENIEALSKRIKQLGYEKEKEPNPQLQKLQRSIRQYASQYLTQNMFILPVLPSPDKFNKLLKEKELNRERIKAEKVTSAHSSKHLSPSIPKKKEHNMAMNKSMEINKSMESNKNKRDTSNNSLDREHSSGLLNSATSSKFKPSSKELGPIQAISISRSRDSSWGTVQVSQADASSSAVTQQIENVKGYLTQARQAGKQDEIKLFEDNLRELMMFDRQQQETTS